MRIAQKVDGPVKVIYTREQDMPHDVYRPVYRNRMAATLSGGKIARWRHHVAGSSVIARWLPPAFQKGIDIDAMDGAVEMPYDVAHLRLSPRVVSRPAFRPASGVGSAPTTTGSRSRGFIDELAKKAGQDPAAFRRSMLDKNPRMKAALDLAAAKSGWGQPVGRGTGDGRAAVWDCSCAFGTISPPLQKLRSIRWATCG